jgi:hypothetical protein
MDKIKVAIYDEDVEYSKRLMNYLNRKYGEQIDAAAFSTKEHLVQEVAEYGFDCVVTNDTEDIGPVSVIRICEEQSEEGYYRYGSAKLLASKLMEKKDYSQVKSEQNGKMIAVYSISAADVRTTYAWEKAKEVQGIYIGMEEFGSQEMNTYWMEELLFLIRERDESVSEQLKENLIWKDGVKYLPSARCFLDYRSMNYEDYQWFIENFKDTVSCPVIFDIGVSCFSDFQIFSLFDDIYFLVGKSEIEKKKETVFLNLLGQEVENIHEKIIFIGDKSS